MHSKALSPNPCSVSVLRHFRQGSKYQERAFTKTGTGKLVESASRKQLQGLFWCFKRCAVYVGAPGCTSTI